jgi:hypothetical protein
MLMEMSSEEITEWQAYFMIKNEETNKQTKEAEAKARARRH